MPARAKDGRAKLVTSVESVRSAKSPKGEIAKPSPLQTRKPSINYDTVFDPAAFLARAGLGRKILSLKKNEAAYAQGDPADAIFYVQKGRLKVTVTSAHFRARERSDD
jgi:CRP-like cAMP-binding protein